MPKKKKTPRNAFYFFMRDFKEEQEQMGYHFQNGMKEVADLAGPEWDLLPPERRRPYEEMAEQHKSTEKGNKYTTMGIPYAVLEKEKCEKRESERRMKMEIEGTVQGLDRDGTLRTHVFYFIHFNYYCQLDDGQFLICEMALAQFNLLQGVKEVYHTIIRQDKIPTGYSYAAKSTSEQTHQIPLPHDLTAGEPPRGAIFMKIKSFLEQNKMPNGLLPPLYTIDEHVLVAKSVLMEMADFHFADADGTPLVTKPTCTRRVMPHNPQNVDIFRVYPLSKLFFFLRNASLPPTSKASEKGFPVESLALRELEKDQYNFAPGIACDLHDKNDTCVYCSKSIVTRWGYLICDHCCKDLRIALVRGRHIPNNAAITEVVPVPEPKPEPVKFQAPAPRPTWVAASTSSPPSKMESPNLPLNVVDYGRSGPPEDTAHHYNINAASAPVTPLSNLAGTCWGPKADGGPLRRPTKLPASVQDAIHFTADDFPDLGSRKMPAAVAGRGRGRARIIYEERSPGDLLDETENLSIQVAGRGRPRPDTKPGSRLAANLQLN